MIVTGVELFRSYEQQFHTAVERRTYFVVMMIGPKSPHEHLCFDEREPRAVGGHACDSEEQEAAAADASG